MASRLLRYISIPDHTHKDAVSARKLLAAAAPTVKAEDWFSNIGKSCPDELAGELIAEVTVDYPSPKVAEQRRYPVRHRPAHTHTHARAHTRPSAHPRARLPAIGRRLPAIGRLAAPHRPSSSGAEQSSGPHRAVNEIKYYCEQRAKVKNLGTLSSAPTP